MKKVFLAFAGLLALVVVAGASIAATYAPDRRPPPDLKAGDSPARIARGKYLVEHVTVCGACHQARDQGRYGAPPVEPAGVQGHCFGREEDVPGQVCASNITPHTEHGIGAWTDGEILRAIREGVDADGEALFPIMPYGAYRHLSDDDGLAIVAYLRTLAPQAWQAPARDIDFPVSFFMKLDPAPLDGPVPTPTEDLRGEYLARVAACHQCHTPVDDTHHHLPGQDFSGGQVFRGPWGIAVSANLTPHATGIAGIDEAAFVAKFREYGRAAPIGKGEHNTPMPWSMYAGMTDEDLKAVYRYLRRLKPIERQVERFPEGQ